MICMPRASRADRYPCGRQRTSRKPYRPQGPRDPLHGSLPGGPRNRLSSRGFPTVAELYDSTIGSPDTLDWLRGITVQ